MNHSVRRRTSLVAAGVLAGSLITSLFLPGGAHAQLSGCHSVPKITLSNGAQVTLSASSSLAVGQATQIAYDLHVPAGLSVTHIVYTGGAYAGKETLTVQADDAASTYDSTTVLYSSNTGSSVQAQTTVTQVSTVSGAATGSLDASLGNIEEATDMLGRSLDLYRQVGDLQRCAEVLDRFAYNSSLWQDVSRWLAAVEEPGRTTAELIVECLENEGVTHVFGIPGEENIRLVEAISRSSIRYVLTRHEQGASFMAETYGRLTGKAGVCSATLGPGAINLLLGGWALFNLAATLLLVSGHLPGRRTQLAMTALDIAIASAFLLIGRAARRGNLAWYAIGIGLYLLDALLFVVVQDFLGIAVHAIGIYGLISCWRAARTRSVSKWR